MSFINQALKGVPQNQQVELLEKFQAVTKKDVLSALSNYLLPLFQPSSSVVVVTTAPAKADETGEELGELGFVVEKRQLDIDPSELEESGSDESETESSERG